jgi:hypothetical protein
MINTIVLTTNKRKSMKSKTKTTRSNAVPLKYDKSKYKEFRKNPPIDFTGKCHTFTRFVYMSEAEFKFLRPRLIHTGHIGWMPEKEGEAESIKVKIYITDGTSGEGDSKIQVAYSYYVRFGGRTWKPYFLDQCFEIVNALRLEQQTEELDRIKEDLEDEKEAKKKK